MVPGNKVTSRGEFELGGSSDAKVDLHRMRIRAMNPDIMSFEFKSVLCTN